MKKTFNVNLGGRLFQIDEDAYEQLNDYLLSIKTCFRSNESGEEIAADIEARLGELFESKISDGASKIVTFALVNEMITRMGKPEYMLEEENTEEQSEERAKESEKNNENDDFFKRIAIGKKLFRDGDSKMFGGVIAGLAAYLKTDVTLLRIIAVVMFFVTTFWAFLIYLVCWAIIPLAITTTDKLRMRGVEPTPESIAENIVNEEPAIDKIMRNIKEVGNKGVAIILVILACFLLISLILAAGSFSFHSGYVSTNIVLLWPLGFFFTFIGFVTVIVMPVSAIVLVFNSKWKEVSAVVKWLMFIDWLLAVMSVCFIVN